jgi:hypothetical protein
MGRGEANGLPFLFWGRVEGHSQEWLCHKNSLDNLMVEVEAIAGLDLGVLLFHGQVELVIADGGVELVWGVAENVLIAEFFVEVRIDFVQSFFLRDFKKAPAGCFGDLLKDFFAVGA